MSIVIVIATYEEADLLIQKLNAVQHTTIPHLFSCAIGFILISGIGPFANYAALSSLDIPYSEIWNIGLAGSLHDTFEPLQMYPIKTCTKYHWHPKGQEAAKHSYGSHILERIYLQNNEGLHLVTSDFAIHDKELRKKLGQTQDIVDMEGYAIAWFAQQKKCPVKMYKLISDRCSHTTTAEIRALLPQLSDRIATYTSQLVEERLKYE